jgi:hypothetical protein
MLFTKLEVETNLHSTRTFWRDSSFCYLVVAPVVWARVEVLALHERAFHAVHKTAFSTLRRLGSDSPVSAARGHKVLISSVQSRVQHHVLY